MGSQSGGEGSSPSDYGMYISDEECNIEINNIFEKSQVLKDNTTKSASTQKTVNEKILNLLYKENSIGPYTIHIEKIENEKEIKKSNYNYMKIANEIFHMNLNNILKVKQKGKNKIGIDFSHYQAANNLLKNEKLLNKGYKIYIPINQITCKGIIRRVDPDLSIDEIKNMIRSPFDVLEIKRLNRKILHENDKNGRI